MTHLNRFDFYGREDPPAAIMLGPRRRDGGALKFPDLWEPVEGDQGLVYEPAIDKAGIGDIYWRWLIKQPKDFTDCTLRRHVFEDKPYESRPRPGVLGVLPPSYWKDGKLIGEDETTRDVAYTIYTEQGLVAGFGKRPEVVEDTSSVSDVRIANDAVENFINYDGDVEGPDDVY